MNVNVTAPGISLKKHVATDIGDWLYTLPSIAPAAQTPQAFSAEVSSVCSRLVRS